MGKSLKKMTRIFPLRQYSKKWLSWNWKICHLVDKFIQRKFSSRRLTKPFYLENKTIRLKTAPILWPHCCLAMLIKQRLQTVDAIDLFFCKKIFVFFKAKMVIIIIKYI